MAIDWTTVAATVQRADERGVVGVTVVAPNGERWSHHGGRQFGAASTVKIPLMVEVFRQVDRGARTLDDLHLLRDDERARGSGVLLHLHAGIELSLADLLYLTISISDNTATNLLIGMTGMDAVNRTMADLGMPNSLLGREMKGRPAIPGEQENWATPDDYANAIAAILSDRAASPESCRAMRELLEKQQNGRRIARYLPEEAGIRWGSKTGSVKGVTNDVGFITTAAGTLILAVFCEGFLSQHVGEQVIGDISRAACLATGLFAQLPSD